MATRSIIAVEDAVFGIVRAVYCHWDGYPEYNGKMLLEFYNDLRKAWLVTSGGAISSLGKKWEPIGDHSFDKPENDTTILYARDRGESLEATIYKDVDDFKTNGCTEEFAYLFTRDDEWLVNDCSNREWYRLTQILQGERE